MKKLLTFILLTLQLSAQFLPYRCEILKGESPELLTFKVNSVEIKDSMLNDEVIVVSATVTSIDISESNLSIDSNISIMYSRPVWEGSFNRSILPLLEEFSIYKGYLQYDSALESYTPSAKSKSFKFIDYTE